NERNLRRAVFGTTQRCQQRNEQHLRQVVIAVAPARVDDLRKVFCEASQDGLLANQGTLSESIFLGRAIDWPKFHAIPLPEIGGRNRSISWSRPMPGGCRSSGPGATPTPPAADPC